VIGILPQVSVVIPTHDRRELLARTLDALGRQTCDPARFEVVIAANACSDDTVRYTRSLETPYAMRVLDLPSPGVSAARNAGAEAASAPLLILLDDDIAVTPDFVEAHLESHGIGAEMTTSELPLRVTVGYLPAVRPSETDFFALALVGWWEAMFDLMREPGHRWGYTDLLSGNFSMPRQAFLAHGGFDTRLRCHEDYELGYRLIQSGCLFSFSERAAGAHDDRTRLDRACWRKRQEGIADVYLASRYRELRAALPLTHRTSIKQRLTRWLAFNAPAAGDALAAGLSALLRPLEVIGARFTWYRVVYGVLGYWYERGVADAAGSRGALQAQIADVWSDARRREPAPAIDVSEVDAAERLLDTLRPSAAELRVGTRTFAHIDHAPGREALAGRHLRPALILEHKNYVRALVDEGQINLERRT
jgi:GT2 family glycosyltransferase